MRQGKVFREEIYPQARKLYHNELVKRKHEAVSNRKRPAEDVPELHPLPSSVKKRKKDKDDLSPSMPALASMLMADPFFVRIVLARVLRELRQSVVQAGSLPVAHRAVPSMLQFLHLARFSTQVCASRGKRFIVPGGGMESVEKPDDAINFVPYATLRNDLPLLLRLLVEAELDKRIVVGEDLHDAAQANMSLRPPPIDPSQWVANDQMEVATSLIEGALVHVCQPGNANDGSLAITFEKFASALIYVARNSLQDHRVFFQCLIRAIIRHKAKLTKPCRDAIVESWLNWLRSFDNGCATSAAHECFVMLLNDWSAIGNLILPRDTLLDFSKKGVDAVNGTENSEERKFHSLWQSGDPAFVEVRKQYERMLKTLPAESADEWKQQVGLEVEMEVEEVPEPAPEEASDEAPEEPEFTQSP